MCVCSTHQQNPIVIRICIQALFESFCLDHTCFYKVSPLVSVLIDALLPSLRKRNPTLAPSDNANKDSVLMHAAGNHVGSADTR